MKGRSDAADGLVVVAGSSGTIGAAVVDQLRRDGYECLGASRSASRTTDILWDACDDKAGSVLVTEISNRGFTSLHGFVWLAGTLGTVQPSRDVTAAVMHRLYHEHVVGFLTAVGALAPFLDSDLAPSVVAFSGGGATAPFPRYLPYGAAKAALVRAVETLAEEEPHWRVNAVAPGFVASQMHEVTLTAGRDQVGPYFEETLRRLDSATPPTRAAALVSVLLGAETVGVSGRLISAPWDAWEDAEWLERLRSHPSLGRIRRVDDQWIVDQRG